MLRHKAERVVLVATLGLLGGAGAMGCKGKGHGTGGGTSTSTGTGKPQAIECPTAPKVAGCTVALAPSSDDYTKIETAFGTAKAGDHVCLCPGTFSVTRELDLAVENVTFQGAGAAITDTVVDFAKQTMGDKSIAVTSGNFTIQNMWVKNSPGDGVDVTGATGVTFRDLKVSWDAGSVATNGAYAVYPVKCTNVTVDNVEVAGAADAAIYVGQTTNAIVKNCKVHDSVAGIESENTTNMEVYGNEVFNNTAGVLVFALPNLEKKDALKTNVHDNNIHDNNGTNFGAPGSVVSNVPVGIGILILAAHNAEIHKNTITNQDSVGIVMVSGKTFQMIGGGDFSKDPGVNPYPEGNFIHDNTYVNCGTKPHGALKAIGVNPVPQVVWDGEQETPPGAMLCLGKTNTATFLNANGAANIGNVPAYSMDATPFMCDGNVLPPVTF